MTDVLTWTIERRVELAERAELVRKELAGIDAEVGPAGGRRGGVRTVGRGGRRRPAALIADCVARAQREGDLPAGSDPIALARALLAAQQGIVFMGRTGLDTATLAATARSLAAQLLPDHSGD